MTKTLIPRAARLRGGLAFLFLLCFGFPLTLSAHSPTPAPKAESQSAEPTAHETQNARVTALELQVADAEKFRG